LVGDILLRVAGGAAVVPCVALFLDLGENLEGLALVGLGASTSGSSLGGAAVVLPPGLLNLE
jgi:hypothetical protein